MCSASMGAEGSVTLQLREAIQAPETQLDGNSFTIGYPESDLLADMLGSIQSAGEFLFLYEFYVLFLFFCFIFSFCAIQNQRINPN